MGPLEWKTSLNAVNCEYLLSCTKSGTLPPKLRKKDPKYSFLQNILLTFLYVALTMQPLWVDKSLLCRWLSLKSILFSFGYLWHLLNKRYLSTPAFPVLSLPFNPTSLWHPLMKVRGGFQIKSEEKKLKKTELKNWIRIAVNYVGVIVDGKCRVGSSRCPFPLSMVGDSAMSSG